MLPSRFLGRGGCLKERITFPVAEVRLQKIALDVSFMSLLLRFKLQLNPWFLRHAVPFFKMFMAIRIARPPNGPIG